MDYRLFLNQPCSDEGNFRNVLVGVFRFLRAEDKDLLRLKDLWRTTPDGISLYDEEDDVNRGFGQIASSEEWKSEDISCFCVNGQQFIVDTVLSRNRLDNLLKIFNNYYSDIILILRSPIGYGYFKPTEAGKGDVALENGVLIKR